MNKPHIKKKKWKTGLLTLNRQFSLVVILGIIASFFAVGLIIYAVSPFAERFEANFEKPMEDVSYIGKRLYDISENPGWSFREDGKVPEIDAIALEYPQYNFDYETYPGVDRETFELEGMLLESRLTMKGYTTIVLEAGNGIVVAGVLIPVMVRVSTIITIAIILLYITFLLLFIGAYAHSKVRYLKKIANNLEYIAGGDLSVKIPLKGKDEIYLVAYHINEMTSALKKEFEKEKEIEETKKQLITNISHDLRTPLTAVVGFLGVLETMDIGKNTDMVKQYIHRAFEKSEGLSHLVDQLFDFVTVSNRQIEYHWVEVEPSVYFLQAFSEMEHLLEEKQLKMSYYLQETDRTIRIDFVYFQRIVENLIQNICKYARNHSEVRVEGRRRERSYILTISNEADNIPETGDNFLARYFTTDRTSGKSAGLGLAICKELIEQQKGSFEIKVNSPVFETVITLPLSVIYSVTSG